MKDKLNLVDKAIDEVRKSSFNRPAYEVSLPFKINLIESLMLHTDYSGLSAGKVQTREEFLCMSVPEFQRDNNKWTQQQKTLFIQNLLRGASTTISLFRTDGWVDAKIIDGLQRITAMLDFLDGKVKVFDNLSVDDLGEKLRFFRTRINLSIVTFNEWEEVGRFYVEMNEGITHSAEDIEKCKKWFLEEKNIIL